jgi:DNA-binding protein HU-beta
MNKRDLMKAVAAKAWKTGDKGKMFAEAAVNHVFDAIQEALIKGEKVTLTGFGSFEAVATAPRLGRNPQTGEAVQIPAGKRIKFKPGKALKEAVK